jgi:hypothetical protein
MSGTGIVKRSDVFIFFLVAIILAMPAFAQKDDKAKPSFSGSWIIVPAKKSSIDEEKIAEIGFAYLKISPKAANSTKKFSNQLIVEHNEPELKIYEKYIAEEFGSTGELLQRKEVDSPANIYYTDKRGEQNTGKNGGAEKTSTKWDGNTVLVIHLNNDKEQISSTKFSLTKDGQQLKIWNRFFQFQDINSANFFLSIFGNGEIVYKKIK